MIKVFFILINYRGFNSRFVVSIYLFNRPTKYEELVIGFISPDNLRNKRIEKI